jgi:nucleoside-diphosphate-sugar epimerase
MRILITGVAGFIGSHLAEKLLNEGMYVTGIDNFDEFYSRELKEKNLSNIQKSKFGKNFTFKELDICFENNFKELTEEIDIVIHLAAKAGVRPSIENPQEYIKVNIMGTQNILDFMKDRGIKKIIFASSSSVYGNNLKVPFEESDDVTRAISPYAFTKKSNEIQLHSTHHLYNIDVICLRLFTVFGPRQRPDLAIRKFIEKIKKNEAIEMYGDGSTGRDYTFVLDIVDGIYNSVLFIMNNSNTYEIINLGNNSPIKLSELVNSIYKLLKKPSNIVQLPMQPGDVKQTFASISKAQKILGYKPKYNIETGILETIKWLEENESI